MAENLILACYLLFSGCIVVALLNVYWQELVCFPHFAYDCIRGWFKIDTPAEREWSLIKASVISALLIAGYLWWLSKHSAFVSQFPGTLVITVIAIPVAWILWIWRNQDKRETLNNEKVKIEQTEKELGWKEDDRLWNNFFERQKIADDKSVLENVRITALYALESYLKLDEKTRFPGLTRDFLFNQLHDARRSYQTRFDRYLWGMLSLGIEVFDEVEGRRVGLVTQMLFPEGIDTNYVTSQNRTLYPNLSIAQRTFKNNNLAFFWLPFNNYQEIVFEGDWNNGDFFLSIFRQCKFSMECTFTDVEFINTQFNSVTATKVQFVYCAFLYGSLGGNFTNCSFVNSLFVGNNLTFLQDESLFKECSFQDCFFINSCKLLNIMVQCDNNNFWMGIKIMQFPADFIESYDENIKIHRLNSNYPLYRQVQRRYLSHPVDSNFKIPTSATDLYLEYKSQRRKLIDAKEKEDQLSRLARLTTKRVSTETIFGSLFLHRENRLPYLKELLDMSCHFQETGKLELRILDHAFNVKKAELEPKSVSSPAE